MAWYSIFIGVALKSTVVLAVAWLSAGLLRGRSAAARHLVWTAANAAFSCGLAAGAARAYGDRALAGSDGRGISGDCGGAVRYRRYRIRDAWIDGCVFHWRAPAYG